MTNFNVGDFQSFCLWCIKNEVSDITLQNDERIATQKLVPSTDGKRVAIREFLVFNKEMKDLLIESGLNNITSMFHNEERIKKRIQFCELT